MDKRKDNGGHSTKSKGVDKRKNNFKKAISEAFTEKDVVQVLTAVKALVFSDDDIQAAKVFLDYTVGKPNQQVDLTTNGNDINIAPIQWVATDDDK